MHLNLHRASSKTALLKTAARRGKVKKSVRGIQKHLRVLKALSAVTFHCIIVSLASDGRKSSTYTSVYLKI